MPQQLQQAAFLQAFALCGLPYDAEQHSPLPGATDGEPRFMPSIVDQLPAAAANELPAHFALCCMPEGVHVAMPGSPTPIKVYSTMLTGAMGNRLYVACLSYYEDLPSSLACRHPSWHGARASRALCLCSNQPYLCTMATVLKQLYAAVFITGTRMPVGDMLAHLLNTPGPADGTAESVNHWLPSTGTHVVFSLAGLPLQLLPPLPGLHGLPLHELPVKPLTECLRVENLVLLFLAVLLEKRVLLRSHQLRLLGQASEALRTLLYPLKALHTIIPVLPLPLIDYLEAPTPFLMGLPADVPVEACVLRGLVVVDLDRDCVCYQAHDCEDDLWQHLSAPPIQRLASRLQHLLAPTTTGNDLLETCIPTPSTSLRAQSAALAAPQPGVAAMVETKTEASWANSPSGVACTSSGDSPACVALPGSRQGPAEVAAARARLAAAAVLGAPIDTWCKQARIMAGQGWCWKHEQFVHCLFLDCMAELLDGYHTFLPTKTAAIHRPELDTNSGHCSPSKRSAGSGRLAAATAAATLPAASTSFAQGLSALAPATSSNSVLDAAYDGTAYSTVPRSSTELRSSFAFDVAAAVAAAGKCDVTAATATTAAPCIPTSRQASRAEVLLQGWNSGNITGRSGGSGRLVLDAMRQNSAGSSAGGMLGVLSRAGSSRPTPPFNALGFVAQREKACRQTGALLSLLVQTQGFYDFLAEQSRLLQHSREGHAAAAANNKQPEPGRDHGSKAVASTSASDDKPHAASYDSYGWLHKAMSALTSASIYNSSGGNSNSLTAALSTALGQRSEGYVIGQNPATASVLTTPSNTTTYAWGDAASRGGHVPSASAGAASKGASSSTPGYGVSSTGAIASPLPGMWPPIQEGGRLVTQPCAPSLLQPYFTAPYRSFPPLWLTDSQQATHSCVNLTTTSTRHAAAISGGGNSEHSGYLTTVQKLTSRPSLRRSHSITDLSAASHSHHQLSGLRSHESSLAGDLACTALLQGYPSILLGHTSMSMGCTQQQVFQGHATSSCLPQQQQQQACQGQVSPEGQPQPHPGGQHHASLSMGGPLEVAAHVAGLRYHRLSSSSGYLSSMSSRQLSVTSAGVALGTGTSQTGCVSPNPSSLSPRSLAANSVVNGGKVVRKAGLHQQGHGTENGVMIAAGARTRRPSTEEGAAPSKHSRFLSASSSFFQQLPGSFLTGSKPTKARVSAHSPAQMSRDGHLEASATAWSEADLIHQQAKALRHLLQEAPTHNSASGSGNTHTTSTTAPNVVQQKIGAQPLLELAAKQPTSQAATQKGNEACQAAARVLRLHQGASTWLLIMRLHEELGLLVTAADATSATAPVDASAHVPQQHGPAQPLQCMTPSTVQQQQGVQQTAVLQAFHNTSKGDGAAVVTAFTSAVTDQSSGPQEAGSVASKCTGAQLWTLPQTKPTRCLGPPQFDAVVAMLASFVEVAVCWRDWWALAALLHAASCIICDTGTEQPEHALQALGSIQPLLHNPYVWTCLLRSLLVGGMSPLLISKPRAPMKPSSPHTDSNSPAKHVITQDRDSAPTSTALAAGKGSKQAEPVAGVVEKTAAAAAKVTKSKSSFLSKVSVSKHKREASSGAAVPSTIQQLHVPSPFAGASAAAAVMADKAASGTSNNKTATGTVTATATGKGGQAGQLGTAKATHQLGPLRTAQSDREEGAQTGMLRAGVLKALTAAMAWMAYVGLQEGGAWQLVARLVAAHNHHNQQQPSLRSILQQQRSGTQVQVQEFGLQLLCLRAAMRAAAAPCTTAAGTSTLGFRAHDLATQAPERCGRVQAPSTTTCRKPSAASQQERASLQSKSPGTGKPCMRETPVQMQHSIERMSKVGTERGSKAGIDHIRNGGTERLSKAGSVCDITSKGTACAVVRTHPAGTKASTSPDASKPTGYAVKTQQSHHPCDIPSALQNVALVCNAGSSATYSISAAVTSTYTRSPRTPSKLGDRPGWQDSSPESLRQVVKARVLKTSTDSMLRSLYADGGSSPLPRQLGAGAGTLASHALTVERSIAQLSVCESDAEAVGGGTTGTKHRQETRRLPLQLTHMANGTPCAAVIHSVTAAAVQLVAAADGVCIISCAADSSHSPVTLHVVKGAVPGAASVAIRSFPVPGARGGCSQLVVTDDGHTCVAAGRGDCGLHVLDVDTGRALTSLTPGHKHGVTALYLSPTGAMLVSGGADGWLRVWDIRRLPGRSVRSTPLLSLRACSEADDKTAVSAVTGVYLDSGRNQVMCGSADGTIRVWDLHNTSQPMSHLCGHNSGVTALLTLPAPSSNPTMQLMASCSRDWTIRVWDINSNDQAPATPALTPAPQSTAPLASPAPPTPLQRPASSKKPSATSDGVPSVINACSLQGGGVDPKVQGSHGYGGVCCAMLVGHGGPVTHACVVPAGRSQGPHSPGNNGSTRGHSQGARSSSSEHAGDGCCLATASEDGSVALWDIDAALHTPGAGCAALSYVHTAPISILSCAAASAAPGVTNRVSTESLCESHAHVKRLVCVGQDGSMHMLAADMYNISLTAKVSGHSGNMCDLDSVKQHKLAEEASRVVAAYDASTHTVYAGTRSGDVHVFHPC